MAVPEAYRGREQTYVKHTLLRNYLDRLGHKIGSKWDCINYVDCFAGPWEAAEPGFGDTSFGIAVGSLSKAQEHLAEIGKQICLRFCFIESDSKSFKELKRYANSKQKERLEILPLEGEFEDHIQDVRAFVRRGGAKPFRFLLLDPKGWTGFALTKVAPLVEGRSAEILVTLMTSHIRRFVTLEAHAKQFEELFGDARVAEQAADLIGDERERFLVQKYAENLKKRAGFTYVSTAAVLKAEQESVHYYLIFGTNSVHGIEVFKNAERAAFETGESARDEARSRKRVVRTGQQELDVFGEGLRPPSRFAGNLRDFYLRQARASLQNLLRSGISIDFDKAFGITLQSPLVWPSDLLAWINESCNETQIEVTPPLGRKKLRIDGDYKLRLTPPSVNR